MPERQLAIRTQSMFEILSEMAQGGAARPAGAHVAVHFRGHWFSIDGDDAASKRAFLIAQILLCSPTQATVPYQAAAHNPIG